MKRILKLAVPLVVLAAAAAWGVVRYGTGNSGAPPLSTVVVSRGDVTQRVVAHGTLQPLQRVLVGSQVSGIIQEIHVDFNSRVTRGQRIAQIDPSTFAAAASSAQAELEAAEATSSWPGYTGSACRSCTMPV